MATAKCFLCESDVSSGTMLSKRRKVNGSVSRVAMDVLDKLSLSIYKRKLSTFTSDGSFICYKCKRQAEAYDELKKKVEITKNELLDRIAKFCGFDHNEDYAVPSEAPPNKKRKTVDTERGISTIEQNENCDSVSVSGLIILKH